MDGRSLVQATVHGVAKSRAQLSNLTFFLRASQVAQVVKNLPANTGDIRDTDSVPGLERSPGGGHGNPLQYSCLENPMDRGACQAIVHGLAKSWTQQKRLSMHAYTREGQESLFQPCEDTIRRLQSSRGLSPNRGLTGTDILEFQLPEL